MLAELLYMTLRLQRDIEARRTAAMENPFVKMCQGNGYVREDLHRFLSRNYRLRSYENFVSRQQKITNKKISRKTDARVGRLKYAVRNASISTDTNPAMAKNRL